MDDDATGRVVGVDGCVKQKGKIMVKQSYQKIQMFIISDQKEVNSFVECGLKWLGYDVNINVCPSSAADWVNFPFLRNDSGSWHGADGIAAFMRNAG